MYSLMQLKKILMENDMNNVALRFMGDLDFKGGNGHG